LADNWNFGTTTVSSPTVEFATTSTGTWTNAPPNPPTNYMYARVKASVSVRMYFLPVVMTTKVYTQTVNSQAIAGQVALTTLNTGLSPYAAVARDVTTDTLGLVIGHEYALQEAHFSSNANCKAATPQKCFNGSLCNDDNDNNGTALWQIANIWGSNINGYWGYTSNSLIEAAILDLIQLQSVSYCPWATFNANPSNCAAATNIDPVLSNGNKNQQATDLDTRTNQDTYRLDAQPNGNKHDPSGSLTNYNAALLNGTANRRRLLTAPVVWPYQSRTPGPGITTVLGYGYFLLESDQYSGTGNSNFYQGHFVNGNDAYCAVYAGPAIIGGGTGGSSTPGAYMVQLVQ
jgi:hypothetical protein